MNTAINRINSNYLISNVHSIVHTQISLIVAQMPQNNPPTHFGTRTQWTIQACHVIIAL